MAEPILLGIQRVGPLVAPVEHGLVGLCTYLKRKWGYVKNLRENLGKLEGQVALLLAKEEDVRGIIQENVDRRATNECILWLSNVEKKRPQQGLQDLKTRHDNINKCCCEFCPFRSLLKLGKDIVKETDKIDKLIREAIPHDQVIAPTTPPDSYVRRHAHPIDHLPSLNDNVRRIEQLLADDSVNTLCIYGLPGVGKTTVMKNLHDKVGQTDKFEIIFWVTMTEKGGVTCVEAVQRILEERLGLKVEDRSTSRRADQIWTQLEKKKSYLLFLDQVTPDLEFKLEDVGIYDDRRHGKVVFACDSSRTLRFITTDEEYKIKGLSEGDALHLFNKIVREEILRNEEIKGVAKSLVRECGGMPKLINVTARKLRENNDIAVWRNTLRKLENPGSEQTHDLEDYSMFFKLAYDTMGKTEKHCLLYWEIFPSGHEIHRDYIIECWRTEELIFKGGGSFGETRDSGHGILTDLVDTGILDRGTKARHYKMFGPFRLVAKLFAEKCNRGSHGHQQLVKPGEEWRNAERVSYICKRLSTLPEKPEGSGVRTLLLQENQTLIKIPVAFFTSMGSLQLLDLHDTNIQSLPSSISTLIKLKSLYLNDCTKLEELPSEIGQLQSLEIFDLSHTGIHRFLNEIEKLTNLKCLRLSFDQNVITSSHNHIDVQPMVKASDTISKLALLEELSICVDRSNTKWEHIVDTIVEQVAGLEELTALCFYFPKVECLARFTRTSKSWNRKIKVNTPGSGFRSFSICVGYHQTKSSTILDKAECSAEKHLTFSGGKDMHNAVLQVLEQAYTLELIGHQNVTNLSSFGAENLKRLEICKVEECNKMESIFDGDFTDLTNGFEVKCLKMLYILKIPTLMHIWKGYMKPDSLSMLTTLVVKDCPRLKNLFSRESEMVLKLPKLQHLEVDNCSEMEGIVESGSATGRRALEKLTSIDLRNLPNLMIICQSVLDWPSLEIIKIEGCESLNDLPLTTENASRLDRIIMPDTLWNKLNWPSDEVKQRFEDKFSVVQPSR